MCNSLKLNYKNPTVKFQLKKMSITGYAILVGSAVIGIVVTILAVVLLFKLFYKVKKR